MTHSSHFGERPDGRRISPHAKTELMDGHMSTYFSSLCSQTLIEDQRENEIRGKKSIQVGKGLVRASLLLGFVEMISHWKANLGRMKRCRASGAAPGCQLGHGQGNRQASPCTGGQSADSEAVLLPHTIQFTLGCYFLHGDLHREGQEPKVKMPMVVKRNDKFCRQEEEVENVEMGENDEG